MRSEKTVSCMRDKLTEMMASINSVEYNRFMMTTVDTLDWVLGE